MPKTASTTEKPEQVERAGTTDIDVSIAGKFRDYVIASKAHAKARQDLDEARAALDAVTGTSAAVTCLGQSLASYSTVTRRPVDLARLQERWPGAFEDCVSESVTYRLDIKSDVRELLTEKTWRNRLRKRAATA